MTHAVRTHHCPLDGLKWRSIGPLALRECDNEHVWCEDVMGDLSRMEYPEFTEDQIRGAEVELYRDRVINEVPDRRAALRHLRDDWEREQAEKAIYAEADRAEARLRNRESLERDLAARLCECGHAWSYHEASEAAPCCLDVDSVRCPCAHFTAAGEGS